MIRLAVRLLREERENLCDMLEQARDPGERAALAADVGEISSALMELGDFANPVTARNALFDHPYRHHDGSL